MISAEGYVETSWGHEFIFASSDLYCGKILKFNTDYSTVMLFHVNRDKTWFVLSGKFRINWIDTSTGTESETLLNHNEVWRNKPLFPHRVTCLEEGVIIEVSTSDVVEDKHIIGVNK